MSSSLILLTPVKKRMSASIQSPPPPPPIQTTKLVRFSLTHMVHVYDKEDRSIGEDVFFLVATSSVGVVNNNTTNSVTRPKSRDYEKSSNTTNANVSSPQPHLMPKNKRSSAALHRRPRPWKKLKISLFD